MNWKKKLVGAGALGAALVLGTATSAFAEGPHYPFSQGVNPGGGGWCAYNWVQTDTTSYPGYQGKHVFLTGILQGSAALKTPGCNPHVVTTYLDSSGGEHHSVGKLLTNGSWEAGTYAGNYAKVTETDMWCTDVNGTVIDATRMGVSPTGHIDYYG